MPSFNRLKESLQLNAAHMDTGRLGTLQHLQYTKSLHQELRQLKPSGGEEEKEKPSRKDKPLHGKYHQQINKVPDIEQSYQWQRKAVLKDSTEALIMAALEQALSSRAIEAGVYHTRQPPRCRLCKEASETVQHMVKECKMQTST